MSVNVRTNYQKLHTYNSKPQGTVQGPMVQKLSLTNMQKQQPLYPQVNHGYNALTFGGSDNAYYKINNGPYSQSCSLNKGRTCTGQTLRENYSEQEKYLYGGAMGTLATNAECPGGTSQQGNGAPDCYTAQGKPCPPGRPCYCSNPRWDFCDDGDKAMCFSKSCNGSWIC